MWTSVLLLLSPPVSGPLPVAVIQYSYKTSLRAEGSFCVWWKESMRAESQRSRGSRQPFPTAPTVQKQPAVACLLVLRRLLTGHSVPAASPPQSLLVLTPSPQHDPWSWVKLPESFLLFPIRTLIQRTETLPPLPCPPRRPHSWSLVLCPGLCVSLCQAELISETYI